MVVVLSPSLRDARISFFSLDGGEVEAIAAAVDVEMGFVGEGGVVVLLGHVTW